MQRWLNIEQNKYSEKAMEKAGFLWELPLLLETPLRRRKTPQRRGLEPGPRYMFRGHLEGGFRKMRTHPHFYCGKIHIPVNHLNSKSLTSCLHGSDF